VDRLWRRGGPGVRVPRLADGERISLGEVTLEIMRHPGHTPESISVLVFEHADDEVAYGVLTGDALFIGDVGRPDLLASVGTSAPTNSAAMLYDSVQRKLMGLPDAVRVFPAHGAGSACGKNLSTEKQSTIGEQRALNYACQPMTEDEFLAVVTEGQPSAPGLLPLQRNPQQAGAGDCASLDAAIPALTTRQVAARLAAGAVVHDARDPPWPSPPATCAARSASRPTAGCPRRWAWCSPDQPDRRHGARGSGAGGRDAPGPDRFRPPVGYIA
jgi:hydroxyacylglutathione hydrolase